MFCWVNKGAKGIALLDHDFPDENRLKYVFDVADVHKAKRMSRKCCMELDMLLSLGGIDFSRIEMCPYPEELLEDVVDENGGKKC